MYDKGVSLKPQEITRAFRKSDEEYHNIYQILLELKKKKFVNKNEYGFQVIRTAKGDTLYRIIKFCVSNKINYNELLDKCIAEFICKGLSKRKFSIKNFKINPRTFSKYIEILSKYGLLIILSKKPLEALIPYNSFLKDLLHFFGCNTNVIKYQKEDYINKIESELRIFRKLEKKNNKKYLEIIDEYEIKFINHSLNLEGNPITLPDTIKLLKDHIVPKELSVEIVQEVQNYQKAIKLMMNDSDERNLLQWILY